jgi:hypothetical protein
MAMTCEHCDGDLAPQSLPSPSLLGSLPSLSSSSPGSGLRLGKGCSSSLCSANAVQDPIFRPPPKTIIPQGSVALCERLSEPMGRQLTRLTYDRVVFLNLFCEHFEALQRVNPDITGLEALRCFDLDPRRVLRTGGGHCLALSRDLMEFTRLGYLCGSILPKTFQQPGAPEYCHVATLIPFQNPEDEADGGILLLEPGFNFPGPIVLRPGRPTVAESGGEKWDFWIEEHRIYGLLHPPPDKIWKEKDRREKILVFRMDEFVNPDNAVTIPLLAVDKRPSILSRDERGAVTAVLAVNREKSTVEMRVGDKKSSVTYAQAMETDDWISDELARILNSSKGEMVARVRQLIRHEKMLKDLRDERLSKKQ